MKVIQVLLHPKKSQIKLLDKQLEEHRSLYNACLELKINKYKENKINLKCFDLIKSEVPKFRRISNCSSMQQTVRRLEKSYQKFFKEFKIGGGFPRFKSSNQFKTIEYTYGDGAKIKNNYLYLQNIGNIKCSWFRTVENIICLSITKKNDKFYVNLGVNYGVEAPKVTNKQIGLDFGLKTFITTSDGEKIDSPKFHKKSLKEEAKIHRRIHKAKIGSKLRRKHKKSLQKIKNKIANRRKDFNHKLSRKFINNYDLIVIEDLRLKNLTTKIKNINRTYADVAFGQFRQYLIYKAENAGKVVIKINPAYTSQECICGKMVPKTLKERDHVCSCGYIEDRDVLGAKNILRRGLASLAKA